MVPTSEAELQRAVIALLRLLGYLVYHTHDSRGSQAGFPDIVAVRGDRVLFIELKSEKGKVRPEQTVWLAALALVPGIEVYLWRPSDLPEIERIVV